MCLIVSAHPAGTQPAITDVSDDVMGIAKFITGRLFNATRWLSPS
jgi:hypothetical protein